MLAARLFGSPLFATAGQSTNTGEDRMALQPMDSMWMSKPPTVSELVVQSNVTFKPMTGTGSVSNAASNGLVQDDIRPDFDTDCLWKPPQKRKERTISMDSTDSDLGRRTSVSETISMTQISPTASAPIDVQPRQRRMSISEMLFGNSPSSFSWGMGGSPTAGASPEPGSARERKISITEDSRFKDFLKHQTKILGDDGINSGGFKRRDYMKD